MPAEAGASRIPDPGSRIPIRNTPTAAAARRTQSRGGFMTEIRWAWRNVRARGWRSALTVTLLTLALAATTIVFSAADSLVFRRVSYPDADRLIAFDMRDACTGRPQGGFVGAPALEE